MNGTLFRKGNNGMMEYWNIPFFQKGADYD
jgi:hypothetical protein